MAETDISKVVSLIMENPKLIEEIKGLVKEEAQDDLKADNENEIAETAKNTVAREATYSSHQIPKKTQRSELLKALKPFLSAERGKAIESMITISDVLETIKER